jgi:hypothetical protein
VAEQVLGQDGGFGVHGCHWGAGGLCGPTSIAFDGAGDPVAADGFNSRVLEYADPHAVLARVGATAVSRQGHDLVVTWRMASQVGVRDFVLRAGESAALHIHLLAGGVYRSRLVGARGEVTLEVDLASGWRVSVGLRPVAGYAPGNRVGKSAVFAGS